MKLFLSRSSFKFLSGNKICQVSILLRFINSTTSFINKLLNLFPIIFSVSHGVKGIADKSFG